MPNPKALSPNDVVILLHERLPAQAGKAEDFVRLYYSATSTQYLKEYSVNNLYGKVITHWNLADQHSRGGEAKIRVYNPRLDVDGWESRHTVVDVVTDDAPFLVDSVRMAINSDGSAIHLSIHPVMYMQRDSDGYFISAHEDESENASAFAESLMHFEIDRQNDEAALDRIHARVKEALQDVRTVVADFDTMRERLEGILTQLHNEPPPIKPDELSEGCAFLQWLLNDHFVFLGYREHSLIRHDNDDQLKIIAGSSLGILRKPDEDENRDQLCRSFSALPPETRSLAHVPELLVITHSSSESRVHRPGYMDYIGIKQINQDGEVIGEQRFLGLYTSSAYTSDAHEIPILRRKIANVIKRSGIHRNSHAERALSSILETYPRNELFQISEDELLEISLGILQLQERQKTTVFIRRDRFRRFYSCLVFIPRDHFNTEVRKKMGAILEKALGGESIDFSVQISESLLARVNYLMHITPGSATDYDAEKIEADIVAAAKPWRDYLRDALLERYGEEEGNRFLRFYGDSFRADYRESYSHLDALQDIQQMEPLKQPGDIGMDLLCSHTPDESYLRFKLFSFGQPVALSEALPMLENMGLKVIDEHPSKIRLSDGKLIWIHDFGLQHMEKELTLDPVKDIFQDAFRRIFQGETSNDGFNRLTLRGRLDWRRVDILRAYSRYLRQVRATFSHEYMIRALVNNADIACLLIEQFEARFDPDFSASRADIVAKLEARITQALEHVESLDEDRIIRSFMGAISATLRTNYYQSGFDGSLKNYISLKFDSSRVPDMPEPRPKYEIFVYSPRVEGVHLRGGDIARGGLRWSDRHEDFRTEVLGLVKAQMVKNAVIVPVGSKGGFLTKQLPAGGDREQVMAEGIACYKIFISGLLDITDNLVDGVLTPPPRVVRHDGDDPYLVVAADKGTATFSDIANGVAASYRFWLDDAFASGGSVGYDHKGMGITARGAWESVKRHFKELGIDILSNNFRAVGIGDMSGDVFGNGMLLSRNIKLVAAFNHQHIFLDPDPDCEQSYRERERLFRLPRSGWDDYNQALISAGGGVYLRSAKKIPLSAEMRELLDITSASVTPNELIRALLRAPVELLWNGGIGTYVKASHEQHAEVGDRANEALRINASELRCRIVAEGGNLGLTQQGRIEFARNKGHIYTDAIDNSAGVDCSDHEVNIKILLNAVVSAGEMSMQQRSELLASMTDEVAILVLKNNYHQTQVISLACFQARKMLEVHARLLRNLENTGALNRALENLPGDEMLLERHNSGEGLTAPELSVLLAYVKIDLCKGLINSDLPDEPYLERTLIDYFPAALRTAFPAAMAGHRLRREIIATEMSNSMVNRAGMTFCYRMHEETGASVADITRAYIIVREIFGLSGIWQQIEALDDVVPAAVQMKIMLETRKLLERSVRWIIQNSPRPVSIDLNIERYQLPLQHISTLLMAMIRQQNRDNANQQIIERVEAGVPEDMATRIQLFETLSLGMELVEISIESRIDLDAVVAVYFQISDHLQINWLKSRIADLPRNTRWQAIARGSLRDDLLELHKLITADIFHSTVQDMATGNVEYWVEQNSVQVAHFSQLVSELYAAPAPDFTTLSVIMRELKGLLKKSPAGAAGLLPNPLIFGSTIGGRL